MTMKRKTTTIRVTSGAVDTITYTVEGADEKYFEIDTAADGDLTFTNRA